MLRAAICVLSPAFAVPSVILYVMLSGVVLLIIGVFVARLSIRVRQSRLTSFVAVRSGPLTMRPAGWAWKTWKLSRGVLSALRRRDAVVWCSCLVAILKTALHLVVSVPPFDLLDVLGPLGIRIRT